MPLLMLGVVLTYAVGSALVGLIDPSFDPSGVDSNLFGSALGIGLLAVVFVGPFYLAPAALLLAALRWLVARGWTQRRLRGLTLITGIVGTVPLYPFIPAGVLYGLIVPLPGAEPEWRRRVLARTCAGLMALTVVLAPLSFLVR